MSCKLKVEGFNKEKNQLPELSNNNVHIWELAEILKSIGENEWGQYKILAPSDIAKLYKTQGKTGNIIELPNGATDDISKANVIAALNGPVAHIYVKGVNGWGDKHINIVQLSELGGFLKTYLGENGVALGKEEKDTFKSLLSSIDSILIREGSTYKIFKGVKTDGSGNITGPDTESITEATFGFDSYVAAYQRIKGLNNPDRSGDIVLMFKDFVSDISLNRYTSGVACESWHGSLNLSDSYVPLIVAYPGGNKQEIGPILESDTLCPKEKCEGNWKVTDIILEIIKRQYPDK